MKPEQIEYLRSFDDAFKIYIRKVKGYSCMPTGIEAVILWIEFKEKIIDKALEGKNDKP